MTEAVAHIDLLGPVRAWRAGDPVALRGVSARTVLACLALRIGSVVSTGELADALWEDHPPAGATGNLQAIISRLRRGLGSETIETTSAGYRLLRERAGTDLVALESLLSDRSPSSSSDAADQLRAALAAWAGEPLADVAPTAWFLPDRSRLEELRLSARDRCNELLVAAGRLDSALVELQAAAAASPLREPTHLLLVEALHRLGRNAEALRAVDRYRRTLVEETGLDPSGALDAVEQRILAGGSPPTVTVRPKRRTPRWLPPETPFVGRDRELATLGELLEGHRLVTVVGTGGVGKSRLVMQLLRDRDDDSTVVVLLGSVDPNGSVESAAAAALGLEGSADRVLDAIAERLHPTPTLMVLDNCEHVLSEARELVDGLLRRVEDLRIVVTSRRRLGLSEEQLLLLGALPVPAMAAPNAPVVQLLRDRVARAAPDVHVETADAALLTDICRLLDGLPLALELAAARAHLLGLTELRAHLAGGHLPGASEARTMQATVSWSLALLGAEARQLFGEACVFPAGFDLDATRAVSVLDDPASALAELVDASMISAGGEGPRRTYRILEPIRQVGTDETPDGALESYLEWVGALAGRAGGLFVDWRQRAAKDLLAAHVHDFAHALTVLAERGDDERFGRLAHHLSYPLGRNPEPALVGLILENSPENPDGLVARVDLESGVGYPGRCVEHLERLLALVDADDPRVPRALASACPAFSSLGDIDRMVDSAQRVVRHPAATDHDRVVGVGHWALGEVYRGRTDAAGDVFTQHEEVLGLGRTAFIPFVRAEIAAARDPDEALVWLEAGGEQARHDGDALLARMVDVARLALLVRSERDAEACRVARELLPELLAAGMTPHAWMSLRHVAVVLSRLGAGETAIRILDAAAASPHATELVGEAVDEEARLREEIQRSFPARSVRPGPGPAMPAADLWSEVDEALDLVAPGRLRVVG